MHLLVWTNTSTYSPISSQFTWFRSSFSVTPFSLLHNSQVSKSFSIPPPHWPSSLTPLAFLPHLTTMSLLQTCEGDTTANLVPQNSMEYCPITMVLQTGTYVHAIFFPIDPYLLYTNRHFIRRLNLNGSGPQILYAGIDTVISYAGLDLDMRFASIIRRVIHISCMAEFFH